MSRYHRRLLKHCRLSPGRPVHLDRLDPVGAHLERWVLPGEAPLKVRAEGLLEHSRMELAHQQERLYASASHAVLIILQGMDAAGKDGTIKHVMSGVSPQGCEVHSFAEPSREELAHSFLWRAWQRMPARGRIGIFNRSYYEEVLITRVHPELLAEEGIAPARRGAALWRERYEDINALERHLVRSGTLVLKFFLNVSKAEQRRRLLERLERRQKLWKFSLADVRERRYWDAYQTAYEAVLRATSTAWAPWYVIPADDKHLARACVAAMISGSIAGLPLQPPTGPFPSPAARARARRALLRS